LTGFAATGCLAALAAACGRWWQWQQGQRSVRAFRGDRDLAGTVERVGAFLGCALTPEEKRRVVEKSTFDYMKAHEEVFEMAPPTMFSAAGGEFMASGKEKRHEDVTLAVRDRILGYCRQALKGGDYPAGRFYADLKDA
jgi:hypothetical protein